jgi:hypothetical protein
MWKLMKAGKELPIGSKLVDFRGEVCTLVAAAPPTHAPSTGRVTLKYKRFTGEYYPSVVNAKWVQHDEAE